MALGNAWREEVNGVREMERGGRVRPNRLERPNAEDDIGGQSFLPCAKARGGNLVVVVVVLRSAAESNCVVPLRDPLSVKRLSPSPHEVLAS